MVKIFNRSKYNRTKFNRISDLKPSVNIEVNSSFDINSNVLYKGGSIYLDGESNFEIVIRTVELKGEGSIYVKTKPVLNAGSVELEGQGGFINPLYTVKMENYSGLEVKSQLLRHSNTELNAVTDIFIHGIRRNNIGINFDSSGELEHKKSVILKLNNKFTLVGEGFTENRFVYVIADVIIITTAFKPGDEIIIDMDDYMVLQNGQNILNSLGDISQFFNLQPGENLIQYRDNASSRNITSTITYKDRYL